ncbi:hypothetical protein HDU86_004075 [Geranomyces michiganensis]|nr:hypothetical protein HDU86_004075 [Geranomyces michiganensis]
MIETLREALGGVENVLLVAIHKTLCQGRLDLIKERIYEVINADVTFQKNALGLRNQRCYAIKVSRPKLQSDY